ncbi:glycosyl transferase family 1 [Haloarcula rubripromontorii]|uniref:Glycosyl transferase family 1 n=1 Tax=Haloarcula rubripromontorii TaxID=1705562 RepID=A0A0M9AIJ1_9EURY|nr:glycosyltransferase family 4 protein [Haloarcula rubripromontorii]KOX92729.1 glycosyl transferase family 1 [Haloarcula rubripromontorii]
MTDEPLPSVCVVTHPLAAAGENATRSLLDILSAVTSVALVTADLPADSEIRDRHELIELTQKGTGDSAVTAAVRFLLNQLRMCRVIAARDEDVVLFFGATSYLLPIIVARLLGKTALVEPRGDVPLTLRLNWEQQLPDWVAAGLAYTVRTLERAGFAAAHGIITYTPEMARQLDLHPESPNVYPTGARYVRTDEFRVQRAYTDRGRIVGFLGRLDEEKNIRELATVAARLPDDVTFRFIGDGDLRSWLSSELAAEIERGAVELTGWVDHDDVPDQLNDLSLLVLPSQPTEGLPTTILEALACGTPVLASPVSGVPDVVREGETGFLLDSREAAVLHETILNILERDGLDRISENGRDLIESQYSFEAACERYRSILNRL